MSSRLRGLAAAVPLAAMVSGCATKPPPPAVTSFARQDCAAQPDLSKAISLTAPKEKAEFLVTTPVSAQTPCLTRSGGAVPYLVYALPGEIDDKTLTVGASLEVARVLSPDISLLDGQGRVTRAFGPDDYLFRGALYSVQFKPKAGEAYVLVAADPGRVGKSFKAVEIGTSTRTVSVYPYGVASWRSGVDNAVARIFSYEGSVQVTIYDSDTKKKP